MHHLIDFNWKYKEETKKYIPIMKWFNFDNKEVARIEVTNYDFKLKLSNTKTCIGYYDDVYHPCPAQGVLTNKQIQCSICSNLEGFKSAFFMGQKPNALMQKHLSQKHYLYLAYFEPGIIKVGTAAESRKYIRPIEQDALIYAYIAESDGFNIQKLERYISKNFAIPEYVRAAHKLKFLQQHPNKDYAQELIKSSVDRILSLFNKNNPQSFEYNLFKKDQIEIVDLSDLPPIYYPTNPRIISDEKVLYGNGKGLRGRYLIINFDRVDYIFDTNYLIGRTIEYIDEYKYNEEDQISFNI